MSGLCIGFTDREVFLCVYVSIYLYLSIYLPRYLDLKFVIDLKFVWFILSCLGWLSLRLPRFRRSPGKAITT